MAAGSTEVFLDVGAGFTPARRRPGIAKTGGDKPRPYIKITNAAMTGSLQARIRTQKR
jgi:hypothetical protein